MGKKQQNHLCFWLILSYFFTLQTKGCSHSDHGVGITKTKLYLLFEEWARALENQLNCLRKQKGGITVTWPVQQHSLSAHSLLVSFSNTIKMCSIKLSYLSETLSAFWKFNCTMPHFKSLQHSLTNSFFPFLYSFRHFPAYSWPSGLPAAAWHDLPTADPA